MAEGMTGEGVMLLGCRTYEDLLGYCTTTAKPNPSMMSRRGVISSGRVKRTRDPVIFGERDAAARTPESLLGDDMRLTFYFQPAEELGAAVERYAGLGWGEAWREGERTIAVQMPDVKVQPMLDDAGDWRGAGPMCLVEDLSAWLAAHPGSPAVAVTEIPGGRVAEIADPGDAYYVFSIDNPVLTQR